MCRRGAQARLKGEEKAGADEGHERAEGGEAQGEGDGVAGGGGPEAEMSEFSVEIGIIEKGKRFRKLDPDEVSKYVKQYLKAHEGDPKPEPKKPE